MAKKKPRPRDRRSQAFEYQVNIAFDPRDISESAERSKQPKLTLMEEVLLLGLKDKQVSSHRETHNSTYVSN